MHDFSALLHRQISWKSEEEISSFMKEYRTVIFAAFKKNGLPSDFWEDKFMEITVKYADGDIEYNASKGKFSTYLTTIAANLSRDFRRKNANKIFLDADDFDNIKPETDPNTMEKSIRRDHLRVVMTETLKRLSRSVKDQKFMEIFIRRHYCKHSVADMAKEYHLSPEDISSSLNKMKVNYQTIHYQVQREADKNTVFSNDDSLSFLSEWLPFQITEKAVPEKLQIIEKNFEKNIAA